MLTMKAAPLWSGFFLGPIRGRKPAALVRFSYIEKQKIYDKKISFSSDALAGNFLVRS